ncbi:MAG: FAD-dependent oxidoreductase [Microbacteriaceae bacterium]|nr:FAD-dependent oxidoreductase [Microbacteriaceae bacterium]
MQHSTFYERNAPDPALVERTLVGTAFGVHWLDAAARAGLRAERAQLRGSTAADLVVVGGGYLGLWTAVLAARREPGRRIVVLEAARVGWAASGRNGGWVDASITHGEQNGRSRWPDEFETLERLGRENLDAFERDLAELGVDCGFARVGALQLALEEHQVAWTQEAADGADRVALSAEEARARLHAPGVLGAALQSGRLVATVDPARLVLELAAAADRLGIEVYERSRVRALSGEAGGVLLTTVGGATIRAGQVALATNAFPSLLARNRLMTIPVYDYALMTEPLTSAQREAIGWAGREGLGDLANQFHYAQITAEGRILWGGYDAIHHAGGRIRARYEDRPDLHRRLAAHFLALFPQLAPGGVDGGVRFSHRWAGVIDTSTRFAAFYGTARRGRVAYAAGFTGLGVGATRFAAEVLLDLLGGEATERTELEMVRRRGLPFPPEPAVSVGVAAMRAAMDAADHREGRRGVFLRTMDAVGLGFDS